MFRGITGGRPRNKNATQANTEAEVVNATQALTAQRTHSCGSCFSAGYTDTQTSSRIRDNEQTLYDPGSCNSGGTQRCYSTAADPASHQEMKIPSPAPASAQQQEKTGARWAEVQGEVRRVATAGEKNWRFGASTGLDEEIGHKGKGEGLW